MRRGCILDGLDLGAHLFGILDTIYSIWHDGMGVDVIGYRMCLAKAMFYWHRINGIIQWYKWSFLRVNSRPSCL